MSPALLDVEHLSVSFPADRGQRLWAVDDVSLRLEKGSVLGIVGESGSGKSTVARAITGQQVPSSGEILLDGVPLDAHRSRSINRAIQMVYQDPYASLNPRLTVRQVLRELLRIHQLVSRDDEEERCQELMRDVGLPPAALDGKPGQFSGGQRQRIAIARALAVEPQVLIADEPVSALDVSVQATILQLFHELRERLSLSVIFISHNLAVVRHLSDRVAVMYLGNIVEEGQREQIFSDPRHPYTRSLLASVPRLHAAAIAPPRLRGEPPSPVDRPSGCTFHPRCPRAEEICARETPALLEAGGDDHVAACHFRNESLLTDLEDT
jgi:oligopeptide/dipeptide ABC transporter ATP-binding protein